MTNEELIREYDQLRAEKFKDGELPPCYEWRADAPGQEAYCHCHFVPGNLHKDVPPHDATNYKVLPWCAAHQDRCDDGPHQWITLDEHIRNARIHEALTAK